MVGTSLKTDEEVAEPSWFPQVPVFREASPYIRHAAKIAAPTAIPTKEFDAALPMLLEITRKALDAATLPSGAEAVDAKAYREAAEATLINKVTPKLNARLWTESGRALGDAYRQLLTSEVVNDAL